MASTSTGDTFRPHHDPEPWVWIDYKLSFCINGAAARTKVRASASTIARAGGRKGPSPGAVHHLIMTTSIPSVIWGSEASWTGAAQIPSQLGPTYHHLKGSQAGRMLFEAKCSIRNQAHIEDGEIQAIREGLTALWVRGTVEQAIHLCVDNLNALLAVGRGPSSRRQYEQNDLEEIESWSLVGCRISWKWTHPTPAYWVTNELTHLQRNASLHHHAPGPEPRYLEDAQYPAGCCWINGRPITQATQRTRSPGPRIYRGTREWPLRGYGAGLTSSTLHHYTRHSCAPVTTNATPAKTRSSTACDWSQHEQRYYMTTRGP